MSDKYPKVTVPKSGIYYPQGLKPPKNSLATVHKVFKMLGGANAMADWAAKNPGEFYTKIWAKTIGIKIDATVDLSKNDGNVTLVIEGVMSPADKDRYRELIGDDIDDGEFSEVDE